jgi:hypothetical protein
MAAVVSIGLSCVSTAFTASTLVYDFDTDPTKRKHNPEFYGYIPDTTGKRVLAFALIFLYHTVWSLGKTFSMAVLAQTNWLWLVVYLLSDHCGLILYKIARGDLIYFVSGLGWPVSMLARFVAKVVVDFTGYALHSPHTRPSLPVSHKTNLRCVAAAFTFATRTSWAASISSSTRSSTSSRGSSRPLSTRCTVPPGQPSRLTASTRALSCPR